MMVTRDDVHNRASRDPTGKIINIVLLLIYMYIHYSEIRTHCI